MGLWECQVEVARGSVAAIEETIAGQAESRWVVLEDRGSGRAWVQGYFAARSEVAAAWAAIGAGAGASVAHRPAAPA